MPASLTTPVEPRVTAVGDLNGLFCGFADPVRVRLLNLLAAGELCVCDLTEILGLPQSSVSRHLAYLRRARLVETTQRGKFAHYRLSLDPAESIHPMTIAALAEIARDRAAHGRKLQPCQDTRACGRRRSLGGPLALLGRTHAGNDRRHARVQEIE